MRVHAHLVVAPSLEKAEIAESLKKEGTDVVHFVNPKFGIDDARELIRKSAQKGWESERQFIVCTESLTLEAQNALLKLFEDPPEGSVFYLIVPDPSVLLPTLRSRLIETTTKAWGVLNEEAKRFLKMTYQERMEYIADTAKKEPEALERLVGELGRLDLKDAEFRRSLLVASKYMRNRGASRKMLAEELALSLPA